MSSKKVKDIATWRKRGYIEDADVTPYYSLEFNEVFELLNDKEAYKRTVAVRLLSENYFKEDEDKVSTMLIDVIRSEKALYTRLEAQRGLEKGGEVTIEKLCKLINQIPNKQHIKVPDKITKKKTYPIARDIPIRILSQIGINALPYIKEVIDSGNSKLAKEALDGFGYILYHNDNLNYDDYFISLFDKYHNDEVVIWKLIRAMSATKSNKLKSFLLEYKTNNEIIKQEIDRTIWFIDK